MPASDAQLTGELRVGLFPLPRVVLFPGMSLPLLVFEPRYRALIADVLAQGRLVAVPRLVPGHDAEYWGRPPICSVFGVGRVTHDRQLPDGRYQIVVEGLVRARLLREVQHDPYRVAQVVVLARGPSAGAVEVALHGSLLSQAAKLQRTVGVEADRILQLLQSATSAEQCADLAAASLVADDALRQQLLEADSVQRQLELLIGHLHSVLLRFDQGDSQHSVN